MSLGEHARRLAALLPWTIQPLVVGAPMKIIAGPKLAKAISSAGGLGFIGPTAKPSDLDALLEQARSLIALISFPTSNLLPIGVGFQTWDADLDTALKCIGKHRPCAAWLYAPRQGQAELDKWTYEIRRVSPGTLVWLQVGTVPEAIEATLGEKNTVPDVLVIQGADAGGHGRATDGVGITTLLPEISDKLRLRGCDIPLIAAGGIADGRGVASALGLGAAGVAMGTRFLASTEANISKGYQNEVLRATDAAHSTVKTHLYNHLRGTKGWPESYSPRTVINQSWVDNQAGVPFDELQRRHDQAAKLGDDGWGPAGRLATYVGTSVGLVNELKPAAEIVHEVRKQTKRIFSHLARM